MGMVIPTLVALPAMAIMARQLEVERFGLFMLAFSLLGYASIFDGGITRAVIRQIASNNGDTTQDKIVMGTATWAVAALSFVAMLLVYFGGERIIVWLNVSDSISEDALNAFEYLSFIIPVSLMGMVWFSFLEGRQQFVRLNVYKTLSGVLVSLLPAAALFLESSLRATIVGLLLGRLITLLLAWHACRFTLGANFFCFDNKVLRELFSFGGWVTLSNIISPLMSYADRFILSHLLGAQRVAFYTAPSDAVARMGIVPGALARTVFPLFSSGHGRSAGSAQEIYKGLLLALLAMVVPVFLLAENILDIWLGAPYGKEAGDIFRVLLIGFVFNALAQIPFSRIQACGNSRLTAILHLVEVFPYLAILWVLLDVFGLYGAAVAWSARVIADFIALEYFSRRLRE